MQSIHNIYISSQEYAICFRRNITRHARTFINTKSIMLKSGAHIKGTILDTQENWITQTY